MRRKKGKVKKKKKARGVELGTGAVNFPPVQLLSFLQHEKHKIQSSYPTGNIE